VLFCLCAQEFNAALVLALDRFQAERKSKLYTDELAPSCVCKKKPVDTVKYPLGLLGPSFEVSPVGSDSDGSLYENFKTDVMLYHVETTVLEFMFHLPPLLAMLFVK